MADLILIPKALIVQTLLDGIQLRQIITLIMLKLIHRKLGISQVAKSISFMRMNIDQSFHGSDQNSKGAHSMLGDQRRQVCEQSAI